MRECFYFSNMTPQPHFFYAGTWEDLERQERKYAEEEKIIVFTGSIGKTGAIGVDEVAVPQYMWKVIYFPQRSVDQYQCFLFPDSVEAVKPYTLYKVSKEAIEERARVRFNGEGFVFVE
jgi:endonuclease G